MHPRCCRLILILQASPASLVRSLPHGHGALHALSRALMSCSLHPRSIDGWGCWPWPARRCEAWLAAHAEAAGAYRG